MSSWRRCSSKCLREPWESRLQADKVVKSLLYNTLQIFTKLQTSLGVNRCLLFMFSNTLCGDSETTSPLPKNKQERGGIKGQGGRSQRQPSPRTVKGQCRDTDFRGREPGLQSGGVDTGLYNQHRAGNQSMEGGCSGHSIWSQYHRSMTQAGDTDLAIQGCQIPLLSPGTSWTSHRQALLLLWS